MAEWGFYGRRQEQTELAAVLSRRRWFFPRRFEGWKGEKVAIAPRLEFEAQAAIRAAGSRPQSLSGLTESLLPPAPSPPPF